jgi:hypothetical protein
MIEISSRILKSTQNGHIIGFNNINANLTINLSEYSRSDQANMQFKTRKTEIILI